MGAMTDRMEVVIRLQERRLELDRAQLDVLGEAVQVAESARQAASAPAPATFAAPGGGGPVVTGATGTVGTGGGSSGVAVAGQRQVLGPAAKLTGSDGQTQMSVAELDAAVAAGFASRDDAGAVIIWQLANGVMFFLGKTSLSPLAARSSGGASGGGGRSSGRRPTGRVETDTRGDRDTAVTFAGSPSVAQVGAATARALVEPIRQLSRAVEALRRPDTLARRAEGPL